MIIVLKPSTTEEQLHSFTSMLKNTYGVKVNKWDGVQSTVLGLIGDTTRVDIEYIDAQDIVENVKRVQEPYKKANRKYHADNSAIKITDTVTIGDGVKTIYKEAFSKCENLETLRIGARVKTIEEYAFSNCFQLLKVYSDNVTPPTMEYNTFSSYHGTLYVPTEAVSTYKRTKYWKEFWEILDFGPSSIHGITVNDENETDYYDLNGIKSEHSVGKVKIIRHNGTTKKVLAK